MVVFLGCEAPFSRQQFTAWATTHSVLWYFSAQQKADEKEIDERYWEMLEDGCSATEDYVRRSKSDSRVLQVVVVSFQSGYFFANHARACHEPAFPTLLLVSTKNTYFSVKRK